MFFLFLDFIAISDCVFNYKNHYVLGHTGYQIIITILVISTLNSNLRVATRVYDVEGGAIFSKNSTFVFFDGAAWTPRLRSPSPIMAPALTSSNSAIIVAARCSQKSVLEVEDNKKDDSGSNYLLERPT